MSKAFLTVLLLGATASMWVAWARARQAASPPLPAPEVDPTDRVAVARVERAKIITGQVLFEVGEFQTRAAFS